ncbi:MAG: hypothetical protein AAGB06_00395 [Verrucomicrobiota bacterium]
MLRSSALIVLVVLSSLMASYVFADIRSFAYNTEIQDVFFEEDRIDSVLKSIWTMVENKHQKAPTLQIEYAAAEDANTVITLRIRASNAYRALEMAGRKAGFRTTISPFALILSPGPDRIRNKEILSEQLALRRLLIEAVEKPDIQSLADPELLAFAKSQIIKTRVLRAGENARSEIPIEFYALYTLSGVENASIIELYNEASVIGKLYLAAYFDGILDSKTLPSQPEIIPFMPEQGILFQTAPMDEIVANFVRSGKLKRRIQALLPHPSNSTKP